MKAVKAVLAGMLIAFGAIFLIGILGAFNGCNTPAPEPARQAARLETQARVVAKTQGVKFEMVCITDEVAKGVVMGLEMCGLFTEAQGRRISGDHWEFCGAYKK